MTAIHVARFGNKASAHDVLGHSGIPKDVLTTLVWRTDAPPDSAGLDLEPFVAAYRSGDHYVLHATKIDADAPRAGMVATTAAIVPLENVTALDVRALWGTLAAGVAADEPLDGDDFLLGRTDVEHVHPPGARAAASAVLESGRVVWTGQGFEEFIECLWLHLPPRNRGRLVIAAAGHPERIPIPSDADSLTVVKTGVSALGRWSEWDAASQTSGDRADAVRDALFGDGSEAVEQLAHRLGVDLDQVDFPVWRHVVNATNLFESLPNLEHGSTRALLQLLGLVQPKPEEGADVKSAALDHLRDLTAAAKFADIRGLRGVPWLALRVGACLELLDMWAEAIAQDPKRADDVLQASAAIATSDASDDFLAEISAAIERRLRDDDVERLCGPALISEVGPSFLTWLVAKGRPAAVVDDAVCAVLASGVATPPWLVECARDLGLPVAHATAVSVGDPVEAWSAQLAVRPRSVKAENLLAGRTKEPGVVEAALALGDKKLFDRASNEVAANGSLLSGRSIEDESVRNMWFAAVKAGGDPWAALRPSDAVGQLLDLVLAGKDVEPAVLVSLSHTTSADIADHASRKDLWSRFPPEVLEGFRDATAQTVARSYRRGEPIEQPLAGAVLGAPLLEAVARESAAQALELLGGIPSARANDAIVVATHGRFTPAESTALGALVKQRNWRSAAGVIVDLSASRTDLENAAAGVSSMFGFLDRVARFMTAGSPVRPEVSSGELRSGLTTVAASLYKNGPMTDALWERAGGDEADLVAGNTGRLAWGSAIEATLTGRRGAPRIGDLVAQMLEDFPNNPQLLALKKTIENGSAT